MIEVDHLCRVRSCVNPDHLDLVTARKNILRGNGLAAINARKEFCIRGHPFDEENTYYYRQKRRRICRTCKRRERRLRRQLSNGTDNTGTGDTGRTSDEDGAE